MNPDSVLLVTGASGAIGVRLRAALDKGHQKASFVVSPRSAGGVADAATDVADITDSEQMRSIVGRRAPTAIIHLASLTGGACDSDFAHATAVNVDAVKSLAELAAERGVSRFVFASTSAVYGDQYSAPIDEDGPLSLSSHYAATKRAAELELAEIARDAPGLTAIALRIFNVFGPGMHKSLANRLVDATESQPVSLAGLDSFVRDYVHVDDVSTAFLRAAEVSLADDFTLANIGSGTETSNRALVLALEPVAYVESESRASYSCAQTLVAERLLGFHAQRPLTRQSVLA